MDKAIAEIYSGQSGGDLPYFVGKQYGTGWLRTLARFAFPILKRALGVATNTAQDVIMDNKGFGESAKRNIKKGVKDFMTGSSALPINKVTRKSKPKRMRLSNAHLVNTILS